MFTFGDFLLNVVAFVAGFVAGRWVLHYYRRAYRNSRQGFNPMSSAVGRYATKQPWPNPAARSSLTAARLAESQLSKARTVDSRLRPQMPKSRGLRKQ